MAEKITDRLARDMGPPASGNRIMWDSEIGGLGLRCTAASAKSFIVNYRNARGVARRLTIGRFPEWSVAAARARAKELKQEIDRGADPLREAKELREAPDVAALVKRYLSEWSPRKSEHEQRRDRDLLEQDVLPIIGRLMVAEVTRDDIARVHRRVSERGAPVRANRVVAVLSKCFALAEKQWGWRSASLGNPVSGLARNPETKRERFLSVEEIGRLVAALRGFPDAGPKDEGERRRAQRRIAAAAIMFLLLSGARTGETLKARWREIDLRAGTWSRPSHHTKTRRPNTVPLSAPARALLASIRPEGAAEDDLVFPGLKSGEPVQIRACFEWACKSANIEDFRPHDLRHSHASLLVASGLSLPVIGRLLGHTATQTTARYAHLAVDGLRAAVETVGAVVLPEGSAEVVPLVPSKR